MSSGGRGVLQNTATTFMTMVATTIISLAARAIMSRDIGPQGMGAYSLVVLVPSLAYVMGCLGINTANIYFAGKRRFNLEDLSGTVLLSTAGLSLLLMVVVSGWAWLDYHSVFQNLELRYAVLTIASIPFFFLLNSYISLIQGLNRIGSYNSVSLISAALSLVLLCIFLYGFKLGLMGAVLSWALTNAFNAVFAFIVFSRSARTRLHFSLNIFREQLVYGLKAYVANIGGFLVRRLDVLLVANILGIKQLGYYTIAFTIAELLWYLASSMSIALSPHVAASEDNSSPTTTTTALRFTIWATALLCIGVLLTDRFAIQLVLGKAFLPSVAPLRWLLPGILFGAAEKILAADLTGRGRPEITMVSAIMALAINIGINLLLLPKIGIIGASIASSVAYVGAAIFTFSRFVNITKIRWTDSIIPQRDDLDLFIRLYRILAFRGPSARN